MFYRADGRSADGRRIYEKGGKGGGGGNDQAQQMREQEQKREEKIATSTKDIDEQFSKFDDPYFTNIANSYLNYQAPLLQEQAQKARHDLPYKFARTDNSDYQRVMAELEADQAREEANLKDKALDVANEQRASVESNRANLVQLANAGTDATSLANQATQRAAQLAKPAAFSPIADLFSKYAKDYATAQQLNGAGTTYGRALNFGAPKTAVTSVN